MDPATRIAVTVASGVASLMVQLGLERKALVRRYPERRCPSCGKPRRRCRCRHRR